MYVLDLKNLLDQLKKVFYFKNYTDLSKNCVCDLKNFANSRPLVSKFKSFSRPLDLFSHSRSEQFWKQNTIAVINGQLLPFGFKNNKRKTRKEIYSSAS